MQADLNETFASPEKWRLKFNVEYIKVCTLEIKAWRCSIIWEEENRVIHRPILQWVEGILGFMYLQI